MYTCTVRAWYVYYIKFAENNSKIYTSAQNVQYTKQLFANIYVITQFTMYTECIIWC